MFQIEPDETRTAKQSHPVLLCLSQSRNRMRYPVGSKSQVVKTSTSFCCKFVDGFRVKVVLLLEKTITDGPIGLYTAGFVGPKTARVVIPSAAARCVMPLSLPINPSTQLKSPKTCVKDKSDRTFATRPIVLRIVVSLNLSNSAGPNRNRTSIPLEESFSVIARKLSKHQHLTAPPLPGWITTSFPLGSTPASLSNSLPVSTSDSVARMR